MTRSLDRALVALLIVQCIRALSPTLDLPSFDFQGRDRLWADAPGKVCVEDGLLPPPWMAPFAKVQLRIMPDVAGVVEDLHKTLPPSILQTGASGHVCGVLADVRTACSAAGWWQGAISTIVSEVQSRFCEDCNSKPCTSDVRRDVSPVCRFAEPCTAGGVAAPRFIVTLPTGGGCVHLAQLPKVPGVDSRRTFLAWELHWDVSAIMRLICGLILVRSARVLRESSALHVLLGALAPLAMVWGVTASGVERDRFPAAVMMPLTALMQGPPMLAAAVVAVASACGLLLAHGARAAQANSVLSVLLGLLPPLFGALGQQASVPLDEITEQDPDGLLPLGWIMTTGALMSSAALLGWLLASHEDPTGEVSFTIGHDGRRIDAIPSPPFLQRCLGCVLSCSGSVLILRSTHREVFSILMLIAAALGDDLAHFVMTQFANASAANCEDFREPISQNEFEAQGERCTAKAMAQLQRYLRENPKVVRQVADNSVNQLHRFSHCGAAM